MNYKTLLTAVMVAAFFFTSAAGAATREEKRVADAADVLDQLSRIPEKAIPPSLLSRAYAVAVVPNVIRAAFGLGARRGKGVLVVRQAFRPPSTLLQRVPPGNKVTRCTVFFGLGERQMRSRHPSPHPFSLATPLRGQGRGCI